MCIPLLPLVLPLMLFATNWLGVARVLALYETLIESPHYRPRMCAREPACLSRANLDYPARRHVPYHVFFAARMAAGNISEDLMRFVANIGDM